MGGPDDGDVGLLAQFRAPARIRFLEHATRCSRAARSATRRFQAVSDEHLGVVQHRPRAESVRRAHAACSATPCRKRRSRRRRATDQVRQRPDDASGRVVAAQPVAGRMRAGDRFIVPPSKGWRAQFSSAGRARARRRPAANVIDFDPRARCRASPAANHVPARRVRRSSSAHSADERHASHIDDGRWSGCISIPPTTSLNCNIAFNLTPSGRRTGRRRTTSSATSSPAKSCRSSATCTTGARIFGFTQSPNGNFAFNFTISLKAEPDLKFDYNRSTVRSGVVLGPALSFSYNRQSPVLREDARHDTPESATTDADNDLALRARRCAVCIERQLHPHPGALMRLSRLLLAASDSARRV